MAPLFLFVPACLRPGVYGAKQSDARFIKECQLFDDRRFSTIADFWSKPWRAMRNLFGGILAIELNASRRKDSMRE
jgi:hypothetical protein